MFLLLLEICNRFGGFFQSEVCLVGNRALFLKALFVLQLNKFSYGKFLSIVLHYFQFILLIDEGKNFKTISILIISSVISTVICLGFSILLSLQFFTFLRTFIKINRMKKKKKFF